MNDHDDYLWSKAGRGDGEVVQLEHLLARFGYKSREAPVRTIRRRRPVHVALALAATLAFCAVGIAAWFQYRLAWPAGDPWEIVAARGDVQLRGNEARDRFAPGNEIATGHDGHARIAIARVGELQLEPDSRLQLEQTRSGHHRVRLLEGSMRARVWAPPGHFGVQLPGVKAVDLGCEFVVRSDVAGDGELTVLSGWVLVDTGQDEVLVPRNATVAIHGDRAGTPRDLGASRAFVQALRAIDADAVSVGPDDPRIHRLVAASRTEDAISLLTLLQRHPTLAGGPLYDRMRQLLPTATAVSREALIEGDVQALNTLWDALPYPRVKQWWLHWKDALPATSGRG